MKKRLFASLVFCGMFLFVSNSQAFGPEFSAGQPLDPMYVKTIGLDGATFSVSFWKDAAKTIPYVYYVRTRNLDESLFTISPASFGTDAYEKAYATLLLAYTTGQKVQVILNNVNPYTTIYVSRGNIQVISLGF